MATHPAVLSSRPARQAAALLAAAVALSTYSLQAATPARADIDADIRSAQAQLQTSRDQTESITEKFNAAQLELAKARRAEATAQTTVSQANASVQSARTALAVFAASAYRSGGLDQVTALVTGDPQTFIDRSVSLDVISRQQSAAIRRVRVVAHDQAQAQAVASDKSKEAQRILDALEGQRKAIRAGMSRQETLLGGLVRHQQQLAAQARDAATRAAAQAQAVQFATEARAARVASSITVPIADAVFLPDSASGQDNKASGPQSNPSGSNSGNVSSSGGSGGVSTALEWARRELGKPYVYGSGGPDSFDCSGLTRYVFGKGGIGLDHYTGSQWNTGRHVGRGELQPGDLVFFYSDLHHVGIYVGGGQMIDAPHSGASVRQEGLWWNDYAGAVRVQG